MTEAPATVLRIGTLGAARITSEALIEPARRLGGVEVAAVAARDIARAEAFAARHGIETVHRSYRDLVEDDSLDAVYVPLPASEHGAWSLRALDAGRHVLVEKPFARNAAEATKMVRVASRSGRLLVEAMHWRYHPLATRMRQVAAMLGPLERGEAVFIAHLADPANIRRQLELGGGAAMDFGCYPVHWLRFLGGEEPEVVWARARQEPEGVDVSMEAELRFPHGMRAVVRASMEGPTGEPPLWHLTVEGRDGVMEVDNPLMPHTGHRLTAELAGGRRLGETLSGESTYYYQLQAFGRAVSGDTKAVLTGGEDAVATMRVIDDLYRCAGMAPR